MIVSSGTRAIQVEGATLWQHTSSHLLDTVYDLQSVHEKLYVSAAKIRQVFETCKDFVGILFYANPPGLFIIGCQRTVPGCLTLLSVFDGEGHGGTFLTGRIEGDGATKQPYQRIAKAQAHHNILNGNVCFGHLLESDILRVVRDA